MKIRSDFSCADCGIDMSDDFGYMLVAPLWLEAMPGGTGLLCLGCVEHRIGRSLVEADFAITPSEMHRGGLMAIEHDGPTPPDIRQRELEDRRAYLRRTGHRPCLTAEQQATRDALQIKVRREPARLKGSPHGDH
jgi:hypothetical protein